MFCTCHTTSHSHASFAVREALIVLRDGVDFLYTFQPPIMESSTANKPAKVFRLRGLSASVFENRSKTNGRSVSYFKTSLQRTYKDGDEFKTTSSLSRDDLPIAELLLKRSWAYILEAEEKNRKDDAEEREDN